MNTATQSYIGYLDETRQRLLGKDDLLTTLEAFCTGLSAIRAEAQTTDWLGFAKGPAREHAIRQLIHEDPLSRHAYEQPRGYPGDAGLLDIIYGEPFYRPNEESELGGLLYRHWSWVSPACSAVRARRQILAQRVSELSIRKTGARVLSIAAGHLREAAAVDPLLLKNIGEWCAIDQDAESLSVISDFAAANELSMIRSMQGTVKEILQGTLSLGTFDFVYAAGLYDYLPDPVARSLTERMFNLLNPGGKVLVANFLPGIRDVGYMEAYMDCWLLYRTPGELDALSDGLSAEAVAKRRVYTEENENIVFLEIDKRS